MKPFNPVPLLFVCLGLQNFAHGEAIKQPPSLKMGEQYRLVFLTSKTTTAESPDIEFYNNFVQSVADAAPIGEWGLEWKAMAATETVNARENTATDPVRDVSVPIYLLDGTELLPGYEPLWQPTLGTLANRFFDVDESGNQVVPIDEDSPHRVWVGTLSSGDALFVDEGGPLGLGTLSSIGFWNDNSGVWFEATLARPSSEYPMFGISGVLTAVPEPSSSSILFVSISAFMHIARLQFQSLPNSTGQQADAP